MQGLADGYFIIPYTLGQYLAGTKLDKVQTDQDAFKSSLQESKDSFTKIKSINGNKTVDYFHKKLGKIIWNECGMSRNKEGLLQAIDEITALREEFWKDVMFLEMLMN